MALADYIRNLYRQENWSQRRIAKALKMSRNTVAKIVNAPSSEDLGKYRLTKERPCPVMDPVKHIVDAWLLEDQKRPRKQRHTAKRIYDRLVAEYGFKGSESTVRRYVRQWKQRQKEVFLPLSFKPGEAAQVDWGEAEVILAGQQVTVQLFVCRLCYSKMPFVMAYVHQRQEAFHDAHHWAFEHLGGIPLRLIYDNTKVAVKKILPGPDREEQASFLALRTPYVFEADFCNPSRPHEKGIVENLVGFARRNFLVPLPEINSLDELNQKLWEKCRRWAREHKIEGQTVWELWHQEQQYLQVLPSHPFDACLRKEAVADSYSRVTFETNCYSVPTKYAYRSLTVKAYVNEVKIYYRDKLVAEHPRLYGKNQDSLKLEHYLSLLCKKPRGVKNARPVQELPAVFHRYLNKLRLAHPKAEKEFVKILVLLKTFNFTVLTTALEIALEQNIYHPEGVRALVKKVDAQEKHFAPLATAKMKHLPLVKVAAVDIKQYNSLLPGGVTR
ncbi:MAG: IS21 family transposase [Peptococcaceae bacterium]|nr:IS21 family transposase [Peptococcaceae bacterium]